MHRRPLVEVAVEHGRCGREGGEGRPPPLGLRPEGPGVPTRPPGAPQSPQAGLVPLPQPRRALTQPLENKKRLQALGPDEAAGVPPPQVLTRTKTRKNPCVSLGAATLAPAAWHAADPGGRGLDLCPAGPCDAAGSGSTRTPKVKQLRGFGQRARTYSGFTLQIPANPHQSPARTAWAGQPRASPGHYPGPGAAGWGQALAPALQRRGWAGPGSCSFWELAAGTGGLRRGREGDNAAWTEREPLGLDASRKGAAPRLPARAFAGD